MIRGDGPAMKTTAILEDVLWGGFAKIERIGMWLDTFHGKRCAIPIELYQEKNGITFPLRNFMWAGGLWIPKDPHAKDQQACVRVLTRPPLNKEELEAHPRHPITFEWREAA